jgi:hypothetical protein
MLYYALERVKGLVKVVEDPSLPHQFFSHSPPPPTSSSSLLPVPSPAVTPIVQPAEAPATTLSTPSLTHYHRCYEHWGG